MSIPLPARRRDPEAELAAAVRRIDQLGAEKERLLGRLDFERAVGDRLQRDLDAARAELRRLRADCPLRRLARSASGAAA